MIEIRSRWDNSVLYTAENAQDVRAAVREAVESGAYLGGADLGGAYLGGAYLGGAYLGGADLGGADLRGAYLRGVDLRGADLRGVDLRGADLRGADLRGADLRGADLGGADLRDADLRDAKGVHPSRITPLHILLDQPGKVRAYKLVNERNQGPFNGGLTYNVGETVEVDGCNTDPDVHCGAGINVATLPWCLDSWQEGYKVLLVEFKAKDIACIPTATDGKFRVFRCKVLREIDVTEIVNPQED